MCLLVNQPAGTVWDESFLKGVYTKNKDGIGMMYAENNVLYHARCVPASFEDFLQFYKAHIDGRACVWHARFATHGATNASQTHPYEVLSGDYPLWLAHNGILHTGNEEDPSKSDTFLYIKNYLRPMLEKNPTWFMSEAFEELVSSHIGHGNKFVLLDAYGNMVTINESNFVRHNGANLSNTYAWDTTGSEHEAKTYWGKGGLAWPGTYKTPIYTPSQLKGTVLMDDDEDDIGFNYMKEDAVSFSQELFATLREAKLDAAYKKLTYAQAEDYFEVVGDEFAYDVLEIITAGGYSDEEIVEEILNVEKVRTR